MLLSIILGDQNSSVTNDWSLTTDEYGNTFISNESIRQKIRLGKKVEEKLETLFSSSNMKGYNITENTFLSNNNKNMNLSLMNFWSNDKEVLENHKDDNVIYITFLNKNYKMISYDTCGFKVIQTYRKKDEYQGLAISFKDLGVCVFSMYAKDLVMNRFVKITINSNSQIILPRISINRNPRGRGKRNSQRNNG